MNKRLAYAAATLVLLAIEVCIALFVHDDFVRPYVGDMLVVVVIYTFIRIWTPQGVRLLPLYVFLFAVAVEALQYIHIVDLLGLTDNRFMSTLIGTGFDWKDIGCYFIGSIANAVGELFFNRSGVNDGKNDGKNSSE